jgi:hypothetical protein
MRKSQEKTWKFDKNAEYIHGWNREIVNMMLLKNQKIHHNLKTEVLIPSELVCLKMHTS